MKIQIDNKGFTIGDKKLIYNLYYFDSEEYNAPSLGATFKKMLVKWADVLEAMECLLDSLRRVLDSCSLNRTAEQVLKI